MGRHIPRTPAELFAEAAEARRTAAAETVNLQAHREALENATGDDREALEHQVARSERIVKAQRELAEAKSSEAYRLLEQGQLNSVS